MALGSSDIYKHYVKEGGNLPYNVWSSICQEYNQRAMEEIILQGEELNLGNNLSTVSIGRIRTNPKNPMINWKASYEVRDELLAEGKKLYDKETGEGHKWFVYHDEPWYFRFYWRKEKCTIPNKTVYQFRATRGKMGNKTKLKELLRSDDLAYLRFRKLNE
jgi:hypothetical protein